MNNTNMTTTLLSLSTAVLLAMTGCGGGSSSHNNTSPIEQTSSDVTLTGVGIDGYLSQATVCLDLSNDGYCQIGVEPASYTDANGTFSLTLTAAQKTAYPDYQDAPLLIYSGFDVDTGVEFIGKIKAPYMEGRTINVSPISTMVHSLITDANSSKEEAENTVRNMLGLPDTTDLNADPIAEAKTDATLLKAALKLQKTIEILAKAKETAGDSSNTKEIVEELYKTLSTVASSSDTDLTTAVQNIVNSDTDLDDNVTDSTETLINQIDTIIGDNVNTTALVGTKVSAIQNEIEDAIQNSTELPTIEVLNTIVNSDFSLLHAKEILRMLRINNVNATDVQEVLKSAGMTEYEFLSPEDEIKALQGDARTKTIGDKLDYYMNEGFEKTQEELETEAIEEAVAGGDLSANLAFTFPYAWYQIYRDDNIGGLGEGIKIKSTTFDLSTQQITETREAYIFGTSEIVEREENSNTTEYELSGNTWIKREVVATTSFSVSNDSKILNIPSANVEVVLVSSEDLSGKTRYIDFLDKKVTFSSGAKLDMNAFRVLKDSFQINEKQKDWSTQDKSYFTSLENFINMSATDSSLILRDSGDGGLTFDENITSLSPGDSGKMKEIQRSTTESVVISHNAGTWEYKELVAGSGVYGLVFSNLADVYADEGRQFFTLADPENSGTQYVYSGWADKVSTEYRSFGSPSWNKIAADDIIAAAKTIGSTILSQ